MKKYLYLTLVLPAILWTGCESDKPDFLQGSIEVSNSDITLDHSNTYELSFNSTYDWTISMSDTTQTGWCDVYPLSGKGGDAKVTVRASANESDDRSVFLTLKSDNVEKNIEIFQQFGCGVEDILIPDKVFRKYCLEYFDSDGNGAISIREVEKVIKIDINTNNSENIKSLQGIEYFVSLRDLSINYGYYMNELDLSKNKKLEKLKLPYSNNIQRLNLRNNTELKHLEGYFFFKSLDLSQNTKLEYLSCRNGALADIDVSNCPGLKYFYCEYNRSINKIDLSNNTALETIICPDNNLKELIIGDKPNLVNLNCRYNSLSTLDVTKCPKLAELNCTYNPILQLDLTNNLLIKSIYCYSYYYDNPIQELWLNKSLENNNIYISKNYDTKVIYK